MSPLDPYGLGRSTSEKPSDDQHADRISTPEHAEEVALAHSAPDAEPETPDADTTTDSLDLGLRLQDAPSQWLPHHHAADEATDIPAEHPDEEAAQPDADPYAPLVDSGGQGI